MKVPRYLTGQVLPPEEIAKLAKYQRRLYEAALRERAEAKKSAGNVSSLRMMERKYAPPLRMQKAKEPKKSTVDEKAIAEENRRRREDALRMLWGQSIGIPPDHVSLGHPIAELSVARICREVGKAAAVEG